MSNSSLLAHLDRDYTVPVRDPLWKHIYLSTPLSKICHSAPFLKLSGIKQLGPSDQVYPGATHSRRSHSLGVYHLAKRIIRSLLMQPDCPALSLEGVKAFLCASLLHDIGHFPFAHSFKELPLTDHEILSGKLILEQPLKKLIENELGTTAAFTAAIVDLSMDRSDNDEIKLYRNILSGVLDPDKLDYLNRDAYFCGVPYGIQDTDFVISEIRANGNEGLAMTEKGAIAIENVLFSKYLMYRTVYWHRGVRIPTALVKKAVYLALEKEVIEPEELYGMDDYHFFQTMQNKDEEVSSLIECAKKPGLYKVCYEENFNEADPLHEVLSKLKNRYATEKTLNKLLSPSGLREKDHILIDIPGKISFESRLPIIMEKGNMTDFHSSGSVFSKPVVDGFTSTLRKLSIMAPADLQKSLNVTRILLEEACIKSGILN